MTTRNGKATKPASGKAGTVLREAGPTTRRLRDAPVAVGRDIALLERAEVIGASCLTVAGDEQQTRDSE